MTARATGSMADQLNGVRDMARVLSEVERRRDDIQAVFAAEVREAEQRRDAALAALAIEMLGARGSSGLLAKRMGWAKDGATPAPTPSRPAVAPRTPGGPRTKGAKAKASTPPAAGSAS